MTKTATIGLRMLLGRWRIVLAACSLGTLICTALVGPAIPMPIGFVALEVLGAVLFYTWTKMGSNMHVSFRRRYAFFGRVWRGSTVK